MANIGLMITALLLMMPPMLSRASPPGDLVRKELAPSGTLRAAINYNNPLLARRDATTGELRRSGRGSLHRVGATSGRAAAAHSLRGR